MTLKSKSFLIYKGDTLDVISQYIEREIGLDSFLIKEIKAVVLSNTVTQLTLLFNKYPSEIVDSIAPREGAIFTSDVSSNDFDIRFLFNYPIDFNSIGNDTIKVDGINLNTSNIYLDPNSNNYLLKVKVDPSFQTEAFHTYQISSSLKRKDGTTFPYTPVGGYVFHELSSAHIGDYFNKYEGRKRGKVTVGVVRLSKGLSPQQGISEYLSQRQVPEDRLISYSAVSTNENSVDVYIIYLSKIEPQIVSGFPLNNSLLPDVSAPNKVTLVFNVKLDKAKLKSTSGLFTIESGFTTSTPVSPNHVNLLDDLKTVEIDVSTYFTSQKIYSIIARPGILSLEGLAKEKPEQWTIHISAYQGGGTLSGFTGTGAPTNAPYVIVGSNPSLSNAYSIRFADAITGVTGSGTITFSGIGINSHLTSTSNPHNTTAAQVGAPTIAQFTGHTGTSSVHFTQSEISIPSTQINNFTESVQDVVGSFITGLTGIEVFYNDVTNSLRVYLNEILYTGLTGHIGNNNIHFTQSEITITSSQVSDFGATVSGYLSGITGATGVSQATFAAHTGNTGIHFTQNQIDHSVLLNLTGDHHTGYILANGTRTMYGQLQSSVASTEPAAYIRKAESEAADFAVYLAAATDLLGHTSNVSNPHSTTAAQVGAPTIAEFTGHTGNLSNPHATTAAQVGAPTVAQFTGHTGNLSNPHATTAAQVGAPTIAQFTGHTGDASIHLTLTYLNTIYTPINVNLGTIAGLTMGTGELLYTDGSTYFANLPAGVSGQVLTMGSTFPGWQDPGAGGGGTPGGSNRYVQYKEGISFAGHSGLQYQSETELLTVTQITAQTYNNLPITIGKSFALGNNLI